MIKIIGNNKQGKKGHYCIRAHLSPLNSMHFGGLRFFFFFIFEKKKKEKIKVGGFVDGFETGCSFKDSELV